MRESDGLAARNVQSDGRRPTTIELIELAQQLTLVSSLFINKLTIIINLLTEKLTINCCYHGCGAKIFYRKSYKQIPS